MFRGRTAAYGLLLVAVTTVFTVALTTRHAFDVSIGRGVGQPFIELADGTVGNQVRLRVRNQTSEAASFRVDLVVPEGGSVRLGAAQPVGVEPQQQVRADGFIVVPRAAFGGASQTPAVVRLTFDDGTAEDVPFTVLGPSRR